ncbi:MAG: DUF368 domain-containing protein [Bacilli bacterium]|nr:DUF368 domain-containing protein [Bacilli bacterium]MBP3635621.1 DUF368 domain-containing protein [Bacilli bacterium]
MSRTRNFLAGILIGIGVVLPGVSGSVIAIMMGVYNDVICLLSDDNIKSFSKIIKLLPLIIGLLIGIIIFGNILLIFYEKFPFEIMYVFIGLILGGVPLLIKELDGKSGNKINLKYFFITLTCSILLIVLPEVLSFNNSEIKNIFNPFYLFIAGFLYISGKIIPGISSSLFLMMLGLYDYILSILANPFILSLNELIKLIPFFIGVIIGLIILIRIINYLLSNYFEKTYSAIIGFVVGSIFAIYPGFVFNIRGLIAFILMIISFKLINKMPKK